MDIVTQSFPSLHFQGTPEPTQNGNVKAIRLVILGSLPIGLDPTRPCSQPGNVDLRRGVFP